MSLRRSNQEIRCKPGSQGDVMGAKEGRRLQRSRERVETTFGNLEIMSGLD